MYSGAADLQRFPDPEVCLPHGGGAVPYHWGRYRGIGLQMGRPEIVDYLMDNIYFDTCVYHQPGIQTLFDSVPIENIIFASEMIGAVRIKDPKTDTYFDDTKLYVDKLDLSDADQTRSSRECSTRLSAAEPTPGKSDLADSHCDFGPVGRRPNLTPTVWPCTGLALSCGRARCQAL